MRRWRVPRVALLLGVAAAWLSVGAWPLVAQLGDRTVQIQDGGGNVPRSLESGDLVVVLIKDADLHSSNTGVATWTNVPEQVEAYEVWDLVSGSPHPSVHTLSANGYDTNDPENTPLLIVTAEVDDGAKGLAAVAGVNKDTVLRALRILGWLLPSLWKPRPTSAWRGV